MKRPDLQNDKYWTEWVQKDGKRESYCRHEEYQKDLNNYIDHLQEIIELHSEILNHVSIFRDEEE